MADFDPIAAGGVPYNPPPDAPRAADQIAQPALPGGGAIPAANPPGFDATVSKQVEQQTAMNARAQTYANDMFPLFKAQQQLALAPTGKGTDEGYDMSALLQTRTPEWFQRAAAFGSHLLPGIANIMTPEQTAAYAEANKYLTQAQLGVAGATRSNEGGATASAASPSVHIPKPAAQAVLQGMIGLRRMEQDQTMQWQRSGLPVSSLNNFVTQFQTNADPRVYVWDQLDPGQRQKVYEGMSPVQQRAFNARVTQADNDGIYNNFGIGSQ